MTAHPTSRADEGYAAAADLLNALAAIDAVPSICEAEKLGGRFTSRVRLVVTADVARGLARRLRQMATTESLER